MTSQLIIQILLIVAILSVGLYFVMHRGTAGVQAWSKIALFLFLMLSIWAILRPNDLTWIANKVGVSRGTDLLLYVTVIVLCFTIVAGHMRFREQEVRYAQLARALALNNTQVKDVPAEATPDADSTDIRSQEEEK